MAAGVTQPGAPGTSIFIEDNANADSNLDGINGTYSFDDVNLKALGSGDWIDLGASPKVFRSRASLQNGDGVGSTTTTLIDTNKTVVFDAGKTLAVSATGSVNRTISLGTKVVGANGKPSSKDGCKLVLAATTTLRGAIKLYGCHLRQNTGTLNIAPGFVGSGSEIINCIFECAGVLAVGSAAGSIATIYNLDISLNAAGTNSITQWFADFAERVTIESTTVQSYFRTGGTVRIRDCVLIGTPTVGDLNNTGANEWDLVDLVWSGGMPQVAGSFSYINDWRTYHVMVVDRNGTPIANCPVRVLDKNGADAVALTYTGADGDISFGASDPVTQDAIKTRRNLSSVWEELGPFTARFNLDGATLPNYHQRLITFDWPRTTGANGDQLRPVIDVVALEDPSGGPTAWVELSL